MKNLLQFDVSKRYEIKQALSHPVFAKNQGRDPVEESSINFKNKLSTVFTESHLVFEEAKEALFRQMKAYLTDWTKQRTTYLWKACQAIEQLTLGELDYEPCISLLKEIQICSRIAAIYLFKNLDSMQLLNLRNED